MKLETLIIDDVDFDMLEDQRCQLGGVILDRNISDGSLLLNGEQADALVGIVNMLDIWSDKFWSDARENQRRYNDKESMHAKY